MNFVNFYVLLVIHPAILQQKDCWMCMYVRVYVCVCVCVCARVRVWLYFILYVCVLWQGRAAQPTV